jgi:hypothetical protein
MISRAHRITRFSISAAFAAALGTGCLGGETGSDEPSADGPSSASEDASVASSSQALSVIGRYGSAWAWVDRNDGVLPPGYSHNLRVEALDEHPFRRYTTAGDSSVTHLATGAWRVTFPNIAVPGGTVHVTSYGGNHHCKVNSWGTSGADVVVYALCFDALNRPVDGRFSVLFYRDDPLKSDLFETAYLWLSDPTAVAPPPPAYRFNSRGALNTVTRLSTGEYQVVVRGMDPATPTTKLGTVQVTAYGAGPQHCKVRSWTQLGTDVIIRVGCLNGAAAADSMFTLSFMRNPGGFASFTSEDTQERFYVWGTTPLLSTLGQSDSYGDGGASMEFLPPNTYRVHLPRLKPLDSTNAQVTANGQDGARCNVLRWFADASGSGTTVNVQCWNATGGPASSRFTLLYSTDDIILF